METKQKIIDTYKALVKENKTADIPVAEICRALNISRKTFYNHFQDRFDLLEKIMFEEITDPIRWALKMHVSYYDTTHLIFENLLQSKDFYKYAIMEECQNSLYQSLTDSLLELISEFNIKPELNKRETEYVNYKFAVEMVLMIRKWISDGMVDSPDFMSKICNYPKI